ncbi:MAG: ATP-grasp domain-containing protein [Planctomycetes bacterium]|nr:ATP-grasp domain-containing protein [Planctomycetota bacterium]
MKIAALIDDEAIEQDDPGFEGKAEGVRSTPEFHVVSALRELKHEVHVIPFAPDLAATIQVLKGASPQLVFNLTECFQGDRRKDANVAAVLELLDMPYTGTGLTGLLLCRDKATCKRILGPHRVRLPRFLSLPVGQDKPAGKLPYPMVVKPVFEDGSDGISLASLVKDESELRDRVRMVHERMKQPAICEEYIEGRELYVGILGNGRLRALPAREILFGKTGEGGPVIATAKVKWDEPYRKKWGIDYVHADLPDKVSKKVVRVSKRIYNLLHMRDYGRIDLRLTSEGEVVFIEANPNPNLAKDEDVAEAAAKAGIPYVRLIDRIVKLALQRSG